jgi:hypothetical protein
MITISTLTARVNAHRAAQTSDTLGAVFAYRTRAYATADRVARLRSQARRAERSDVRVSTR